MCMFSFFLNKCFVVAVNYRSTICILKINIFLNHKGVRSKKSPIPFPLHLLVLWFLKYGSEGILCTYKKYVYGLFIFK